jgi:hypothetical protein
VITLKKLKLNIKYIGGKTKKCREYNLTNLPKKIIKLPKAKRAKSKKYHKEGYRVSTWTYDILELN